MSTQRTPPPAYPLGFPGDRFVHAGPQLEPRTVSVPTPVRVEEVCLDAGAEVFSEVGAILSALDSHGAGAEIVSGGFSTLNYVRPAYGPDAAHPMHFSQPFRAECPAVALSGSGTLGLRSTPVDSVAEGQRPVAPFAHFHATWKDRGGNLQGGHLLPGTVVGEDGLTLRVFAYSAAELVSETDPETGLPTFTPRPWKPPVSAAGRVTTPTRRGVISRVRPGQIIDEAVLEICRAAGFSTAEVRGSLGSTVGAVFDRRPSRGEEFEEVIVDWPAAEYTVFRGTVAESTDGPRVEFFGEAVDVHGQVLSGSLRLGINPVAVTFELLVLGSRD